MSEISEQPWTVHDSNLALFAALSTKTPSRPLLPTELILQILEHPSRWILTASSHLPMPTSVSNGEAERAILHTSPLTLRQLPFVRRIIFTIRIKDQGWSSYGEHHGTYENSWTWFEAGLRNCTEEEDSQTVYDEGGRRKRLTSNRHAGPEAEDYMFEFGMDDSFFKDTKKGDEVVLWALARYGGWKNFVQDAAIEIWSVDSMSEV